MIDEGPSPEDLDRFGGDTGYCPECGAEIWDQAEACSECGAWIGSTSSREPAQDWFRRKWVLLVLIAVIVAFALIYVL